MSSLYRSLVFPILSRADAEDTHERTAHALEVAQATPPGRALLSVIAGRIPARPVELCGVTFPNVLGIAAGFDKGVQVARGLAQLGFGHIEVGTLTPRPQGGNPRPRVFRLKADNALINRMGFPNPGVEAVLPRLAAVHALPGRSFRIGVSLGKQKETPLAEAAADYVVVMERTIAMADYLAVNISSPNTPGLRELQGGRYLLELLRSLVARRNELTAGRRVPLFVKIAPDLTPAELEEIIGNAVDAGVDGIIATNTTLSREGLTDPLAGETGGLSGAPVRVRSTAIIRAIRQQAGERLAIIGVGGVRTADDVREKLDAGAGLVQVYTGLVYEGPAMAGRILRALA